MSLVCIRILPLRIRMLLVGPRMFQHVSGIRVLIVSYPYVPVWCPSLSATTAKTNVRKSVITCKVVFLPIKLNLLLFCRSCRRRRCVTSLF